MRSSASRLLEEVLALPEDVRADLVEALIESFDAPAEPSAEVEAAWADEIARRLKDVETGAVRPIPWEEARKMIFGSRDDAPSR
jgi:putative addiction module component (TIGR02574 family)